MHELLAQKMWYITGALSIVFIDGFPVVNFMDLVKNMIGLLNHFSKSMGS